MPIETTYQTDPPYLCFVGHGAVAFDELMEGLRRGLDHPAFVPGAPALVDLRGTEDLRMGYAHIQNLANFVAHHPKIDADAPVAILVSSMLAYGLGRMMQAMSDQKLPKLIVTRDAARAADWLDRPVGAHPPFTASDTLSAT